MKNYSTNSPIDRAALSVLLPPLSVSVLWMCVYLSPWRFIDHQKCTSFSDWSQHISSRPEKVSLHLSKHVFDLWWSRERTFWDDLIRGCRHDISPARRWVGSNPSNKCFRTEWLLTLDEVAMRLTDNESAWRQPDSLAWRPSSLERGHGNYFKLLVVEFTKPRISAGTSFRAFWTHCISFQFFGSSSLY